MNKDTDWQACYTALGVSTQSDWKTIQMAYRRLAQARHPDRFESGSAEHQKAELEIVVINRAYHALTGYFRKHGRLPGERLKQPARPSVHDPSKPVSEPTNRNETAHTYQPVRKTGAIKRSVKFALKISLVATIGYVTYLYLPAPEFSPFETVANKTSIDDVLDLESADKDTSSPATPDNRYFRPGSTMGEVHAIQGNPSRTEGSTWYYGKSYVTFVDGTLKSWRNDPEFPLRIAKANPNSGRRTSHSRLTSRFTVGSTKADVYSVQGRPSSKTETRWDYGLSSVYFKNDFVIKWSESPLHPLKADKDLR